MRVPISWLKEYVDINISVQELADKLTFAGLEVEKIELVGLPGAELEWERDKIVTGEVLNVERHPNADRLLLVDVNIGKSEPLRLVTGAPNLHVGDKGQKVVVALNGARLYDGHKDGRVLTTLKPAMLRGIKNDSMVCSEKELGISDEHDGIIILPSDAPVGVPAVDVLGDAVLEIAILPNTARCASMIGVAREVAALTGQRLHLPHIQFTETGARTDELASVTINDARLNPRFTVGIVRGVRLAPSPAWMQRRLNQVGIRAINNLVDISNYVMMETGQPTHAFDMDAVPLENGKRAIVTRLAHAGETLVTLDGKSHELAPTDILVASPSKPLSVAGVMGGLESEVKDTTTNILFEVASWDPISIRRTARLHDFHSEASYRFARGVHPEVAMWAQRRGLQLLQELAGGEVARGILDVYPQPRLPVVVEFDPSECTRLLGVPISNADITRTLTALEFVVEPISGSDHLRVTAPLHRLDIEGQHDLVEEVGRIYGYDRVPNQLIADALAPAFVNPVLAFEDRVKDVLAESGLQEIVTYRMTTPQAEQRSLAPGTPADDREYITLKNPINPERNVMRHTLINGALDTLAANLRHQDSAALFEVGAVYLADEDGDGSVTKVAGIDEQPRLTVVMSGARRASGWHEKSDAQFDFFDIKGTVESLMDGLHIAAASYAPMTHPTFYPGRTAALMVNGARVGVLGQLHPLVQQAYGIDAPVMLADIDLVALRAASGATPQTRDVPQFPAIKEDLAVIVNEEVSAAQVEQAIRRAGGALLSDVTLFDVYRGEQIGAGKKSLAYSLAYQSADHTLSDKEIEKPRAKIIRTLESQLGATMRA